MDLYADNILDHYRHPHAKKSIADPTVTHEEQNLSCGDALTLNLKIADGRITELGWEGTGCAISQAAMSMLSDELTGMTVKKAADLSPKDIYALLGVPIGSRRMKCALLGLHTLKNALNKLAGAPPESWIETVSIDD